MTTEIDMSARYRVKSWRVACAVYVYGFPQVWEPYTCLCTDEEGNEYEEDTGEGEMVDDVASGDVLVVMVGDDHKHRVSVDDLEMLGDLDYCTECGQIGCCHDGRSRD